MRRDIRTVRIASSLLFIGCTGQTTPIPIVGPEIRDRTTCVFTDSQAPPEGQAMDCAVVFIRNNGYTDEPAITDTTALALESFQRSNGWRDALTQRHGTLSPQPLGVCKGSSGYTVGFAYAGDSTGVHGRGVTMTLEYHDLRVEHQDLPLNALHDRQYGCRPATDID